MSLQKVANKVMERLAIPKDEQSEFKQKYGLLMMYVYQETKGVKKR